MIIETIVSTLDKQGRPNFAPMGVVWDCEMLVLRPFRSSDTYRNLASTGCGVVNITDDVLAYVQCALYNAVLPHRPAESIPGVVMSECCCWREVQVNAEGGSGDRAELQCRVLHDGRQRDFLGFCRARNAVIEAAIAATRLGLLDPDAVARDLRAHEQVVQKTGGEIEKRAFQLICDFIRQRGLV